MYVHNVLLEVVSVELTFKGWLTPMSDQDAVFSKVTGARRKSPATSSVSAGYFWKSKLKKKIKKT